MLEVVCNKCKALRKIKWQGTTKYKKRRAVREWISANKQKQQYYLITKLLNVKHLPVRKRYESGLTRRGNDFEIDFSLDMCKKVDIRLAWMAAKLPPTPLIKGWYTAIPLKRVTAKLRIHPPRLWIQKMYYLLWDTWTSVTYLDMLIATKTGLKPSVNAILVW